MYPIDSAATHAVVVYDAQGGDVLVAPLAQGDLERFAAERITELTAADASGAYTVDAFNMACERMDEWLAKLPSISSCGGGSACARAEAETTFITTLRDAPKEEVIAALVDSTVYTQRHPTQ